MNDPLRVLCIAARKEATQTARPPCFNEFDQILPPWPLYEEARLHHPATLAAGVFITETDDQAMAITLIEQSAPDVIIIDIAQPLHLSNELRACLSGKNPFLQALPVDLLQRADVFYDYAQKEITARDKKAQRAMAQIIEFPTLPMPPPVEAPSLALAVR